MKRARKICTLLIQTVLFPAWLTAQPSEMKTLLGEDTHFSAFGSIRGGAMPFAGKYVPYVGGDIALTLNNFFVGGYNIRALEFQDVHHFDAIYYEDRKLGLSEGGVSTGITFLSRKLVQYAIMTDIGWGHLMLRSNESKEILMRDRINTITPVFQIKLNMTSYVQICFGMSYQFLFGVDFPQLTNDDFQGFNGSITARFGWF